MLLAVTVWLWRRMWMPKAQERCQLQRDTGEARDSISPMLALKPQECWETTEKNKFILCMILFESFQAWQKWFWSMRFPSWFMPSKDNIIQMWSQLQWHFPRHGLGFVWSPSGGWTLAQLSWCCSHQHFITIYIGIMWLPSMKDLSINKWVGDFATHLSLCKCLIPNPNM